MTTTPLLVRLLHNAGIFWNGLLGGGAGWHSNEKPDGFSDLTTNVINMTNQVSGGNSPDD
jgi:hypothetical protein